MENLIKYCFDEHVKDLGEVDFSFEEYRNFWINNLSGNDYEMVNRNKSVVKCKVAYYPLPYYKDLRALIEINDKGISDFREVPIYYLKKV